MVLWRAEEHEALAERRWDEARARDAVGAIVADAEAAAGDGVWPAHPLDEPDVPSTTLYLGGAGIVWALHRLGSSLDLGALVERALARYRASPDLGETAHPPSLLLGEAGILVVAAKLGSPSADPERLRQLVDANRAHATWELMWGSPGTILAARACGLDGAWAESAELLQRQWDEETDLWTQDLYGSVGRILGPVHGFAGNAHALRGFVPDDELRARVTRALERTALREDGLVNWPPAAAPGRDASQIRVQWCHGAPGILATLADLIPPELALPAGELIWRAGPLRKGSGLCHGTAGNGYAFLKLFALTGDELWLERARRFAMHAIEQVGAESRRVGRGRYGLMTGDLGVALYLRSCAGAEPAFPLVDAW